MPLLVLKAHFDGNNVKLDEPHDLLPDTPVTVTVLEASDSTEQSDWTQAATQSLASAYGDDEPEYTLKDLKP